MSDLRQILTDIYDKAGVLTPDLVVETATPKTHPLHDHFEWDDKIAGPEYRKVQAMVLIRRVKRTYKDAKDRTRYVREFHAVRKDVPYAYDPVEVVAADPVSMEALLAQMRREYRVLKSRYEHLAEFWEMIRSDVAA